MPAAKTPATVQKTEDEATGDVKRGMTKEAIPMTEDQRRASGIDAGSDAGPHSFAPEDNKTNGGTVLDTYAGMPVGEHPNASGEAGTNGPLTVGQAPTAAARPVRGAKGVGEQFNPGIPNQIMQSPVIRSVNKDIRNDPAHPDFEKADKNHPDYGKPQAQHKGVKAEAPSFAETMLPDSGEAEAEPVKSTTQPGAAVANTGTATA